MKNYKSELEKLILDNFYVYLEVYGIRQGKEMAKTIGLQIEVHQRRLEREVA